MTDNLQDIIAAIKENNVISIVYEKDGKKKIHKLHPYYLFKSGSNIYLLGLSDGKAEPTTFKLPNIKEVQTTALQFSESKKALRVYLNDNPYFKGRIEGIDINKDTKMDDVLSTIHANFASSIDMKKSKYPRLYKVFTYYERSMKSQNLVDMTINMAEDLHYYLVNLSSINQLFNTREKIALLDGEFKNLFPEWDKQIKYQPDLTLYLGYPFIQSGNHYIPILYYRLNYDIGKNCICLIDQSFEVNGRFLDEDLELTEDEKAELLQELKKLMSHQSAQAQIFSKLNQYFRDVIEQDYLINQGIMFLNTSTNITKRLVKELCDFKKLQQKDVHVPLRSLVEFNDSCGEFVSNDFVYNIIDINNSQEKVIREANRNLLLVQGPPGTGKTQTIVNIIANEVIKGNRVLVASVNNKAVDNVVEKFKHEEIFGVTLRLGNQENRARAKEEVNNILNRNYEKAAQKDIEIRKTESRQLYLQITEFRKILKEIYELELLEAELDNALLAQETELTNAGISKEIINSFIVNSRPGKLNEYNHLVVDLNRISLYCEKVDQGRDKWFWCFLTRFHFNYDLYWGKRIRKRLVSIGIPDHYLGDCLLLEQIYIKIAQCLSIIQYQIIVLKLSEVRDRLLVFDKEKVISQLNHATKDKIANDQWLLKAVHNNAVYHAIKDKKDALLRYINMDGMNTGDSYTDIYNDLLSIFPVIAATSYAIASSIPQNTLFDLAIIDEASQCNIASSLPVIRRAKRTIVVGDDKQLSPVVTIEDNIDERNLDYCELKEHGHIYSFKKNSTFDLVNSTIDQTYALLLNEHYRCHPQIIEFSNAEFYDGLLNIRTEFIESDNTGITAIHVPGRVNYHTERSRSAYNDLEADYVIEFLLSNYHFFADKTVGIITPFRRQKELIHRKLSQIKSSSNDEQLKRFISELTIGTVHLFQGDECDIILFSSVLAPGVHKGSIKWVNENANLINVAITRAREWFVLFGDLTLIKNHDGILSKLVRYIEFIGTEGPEVKIKSIFNVYRAAFPTDYAKVLENPYIKSILNKGEENIYMVLKNIIDKDFSRYELGVKIRIADILNINRQQISNQEYYYSLSAHFDFVVFDKINNTRPVLAIELDGKYHRADKKTIMNDSMKNRLCELFGFPLERISTDGYWTKDIIVQMLSKYCI